MIWLLVGWCTAAVLLAAAMSRTLMASRRMGCFDGADDAGTWSPGTMPEPSPHQRLFAADAADETAAVGQMLERLDQHHPRLAKVVLLRCIGGLSTQAVAEVLGTSVSCVERDMVRAQVLLRAGGVAAVPDQPD